MGSGFGVRVLIHLARVRQVRVFHIFNVAASHVLIEHDFVSLMLVGTGGARRLVLLVTRCFMTS